MVFAHRSPSCGASSRSTSGADSSRSNRMGRVRSARAQSPPRAVVIVPAARWLLRWHAAELTVYPGVARARLSDQRAATTATVKVNAPPTSSTAIAMTLGAGASQ
jgi:hypothetical protein